MIVPFTHALFRLYPQSQNIKKFFSGILPIPRTWGAPCPHISRSRYTHSSILLSLTPRYSSPPLLGTPAPRASRAPDPHISRPQFLPSFILLSLLLRTPIPHTSGASVSSYLWGSASSYSRPRYPHPPYSS